MGPSSPVAFLAGMEVRNRQAGRRDRYVSDIARGRKLMPAKPWRPARQDARALKRRIEAKNKVMPLDLPTLLVMQSFALACAGAVLIVAWAQNRTIKPLALWGIAHILAAGGFVSLMFGLILRQPVWVLGVTLLVLQSSLVWKAAQL